MAQVSLATVSAWPWWRCSWAGARSRPNGIFVNPYNDWILSSMRWSPFRYWRRWSAAGGAAGGHDGVGDGGEVLVVRAGDRVPEPDRQAGGEAGRDLQDRGFAAGAGQLPCGQGAGGGLPAGRPLSGLAPVAMNAVVKSVRVSQW